MDQTPITGQGPLVPPDAEMARQYLAEAAAVTERRDRAVDRRALARLQIINAAATAVFLIASVILLRRPEGGGAQALLFGFLLYSQVMSGIAQRSGLQWRFTRERAPVVIVGAVVMVIVIAAFGLAVFVPSLPRAATVLPGVLVLGVFGGFGAVQLVRAPREPLGQKVPRVPLPRAARVGMFAVGILFGALLALASAPAGAITSTLLLLIAVCVLAWLAASSTDFGLPALGALWRWPHEVGLAIAVILLLGLTLLDLGGEGGATTGALAGGAVVLLFVALSFVPGRGERD